MESKCVAENTELLGRIPPDEGGKTANFRQNTPTPVESNQGTAKEGAPGREERGNSTRIAGPVGIPLAGKPEPIPTVILSAPSRVRILASTRQRLRHRSECGRPPAGIADCGQPGGKSHPDDTITCFCAPRGSRN